MRPTAEVQVESDIAEISPEIRSTELPHELATELLDQGWRSRIFNPAHDARASWALQAQRESWRDPDDWPTTTVFNTGVYDLLHLDHMGFLVNTKMQGAGIHFDRHYQEAVGTPWGDLPEASQHAWASEFMLNGELRQVVTIRGNTTTAKLKGFNPEKGNTPRPILDWETRARTVAGVVLRGPEGGYVPVADAITIHDADEFAGTPHENLLDLAEHIDPDVWAIYHESATLLEKVPADPRFADTTVVLVGEGSYFPDKMLDYQPFSTTAIARRILGT